MPLNTKWQSNMTMPNTKTKSSETIAFSIDGCRHVWPNFILVIISKAKVVRYDQLCLEKWTINAFPDVDIRKKRNYPEFTPATHSLGNLSFT